MHTGYDNYWMYQNRRQELVLCLPKNDNFNRPVFTDNYKQVQGTGHPSNMGNYISPPNTVARHHEKVPQDQHVVTGSQSMWPSSVCLPPYTTSLTQNYVSHDVFSVQPNNVCASSETTNQVLRNAQNSNVNLAQVQSTNYKASAGPVNNQNGYYRAQTARIKVKDVFSLNNDNNSNNHNYNNNFNNNNINNINNNNNNKNNNSSSLTNDLYQAQAKKQHYYPYNSATFRNNRIYGDQGQRECANYDNTSELSRMYLNYGPPATHMNMQPPPPYYQQNAQCAYKPQQHCCNSVQQISENTPEAYSQTNYQLLRQKPRENITQQGHVPNTQRDSDNSAGASKSFPFNLPSVAQSNEANIPVPAQVQSDLSKNLQAPRASFIPSARYANTEATAMGAKSPHRSPVIQERTTMQIATIPRVDQSASNCGRSEPGRSSECLPPSGGATDSTPVGITRRNSLAHDGVGAQKDTVGSFSVAESVEENRTESPKSSVGCSAGSYLSEQQESVPGQNAVVRPTESHAEEPKEGMCSDAVCPSETVLMTVKVEKSPEEGQSFEEAKLDESDGEALPTIKTEVDLPEGECDTEEEEEANEDFSKEPEEVSDDENGASDDIPSLKRVEPQSTAASITSNRSEEPDMREDSSERAENGNDKCEAGNEILKVRDGGNEKVALVLGGKYQSEINRDKLDLLIKFLKKEGGPVEIERNSPPTVATNPEKEYSWKQRRRKLSKTCVVKNKNTEREMVSLMSYKTPKCSSRSFSIKVSETPETESGWGDARPAEKGSGQVESDFKIVSKEKEPEEIAEESFERRRQRKNTQVAAAAAAADKRLKETSENCSSNGNGVTTEKRHLINIMRAFQNLKNHFCASCDIASPVGSIWINVVSGELRCLNCFKKMMLKAEENPSSLRKSDVAGVNTSKAEDDAQKDEAGDGRGSKAERSFEKKSKGEGQAKSTPKPEDLKGHVKKEVDASCENMAMGSWKKESSSSMGKEQRDSARSPVWDERAQPESKRTNPSVSETQKRKERKQSVDSPERSRKRNIPADEFVLRKVQALEEGTKDAKQKASPVEKSVPKESAGHEKNWICEEATKKSRKEEWKKQQQHSREGWTEHKSQKTEHGKAREEKRKGDGTSEKQKRKRPSSEEEFDSKKIRMVEECVKGDSSQNASEKSKERRGGGESKEDGHKNKAVEKGKNRKSTDSKDDHHSRKKYEEPSKPTTKLIDMFAKLNKRTSPNETNQGKAAEALEPLPASPKAKSPSEDSTPERRLEGFDTPKSHSPDNQKRQPNDQKDAEKRLMEKQYRKSKQYLISRLFKGKQNTKVDPNLRKLADEASHHKKHKHRKHHRKQEQEKSDKSTREKSSHRGSARLRTSDGNRHVPKHRKDKAVECSFDEIITDFTTASKSKASAKDMTSSTALLARLMKKTKKLSWSLLGEAMDSSPPATWHRSSDCGDA